LAAAEKKFSALVLIPSTRVKDALDEEEISSQLIQLKIRLDDRSGTHSALRDDDSL
jgi:hypothetical protein